MKCPLCHSKNAHFYHQDIKRSYWQCSSCQLVYVDAKYYLDEEKEKQIYDLHQNNPNDEGYRQFLNKLLTPLIEILDTNMLDLEVVLGLDFGCGPGPCVSMMLSHAGYKVNNYDVFYAKNPQVLNLKYDFITCTEVIEHLFDPHKCLSLFSNILAKDGYLGIMTKRVINKEKFKTWHYKNDPTHVCFYSDSTFDFVSKKWGFETVYMSQDVIILKQMC